MTQEKKPGKGQKSVLSQSGNVFFTLFGAVGLVGVVGASTMTIMKGPVKSMSEVTRRTIAENAMIASGKLALVASKSQVGDCDDDDSKEPIEWSTSGTGTAPSGGGFVPASIGASLLDPWGTTYGFCVWDHGDAIKDTGCGGAGAKRLSGSSTDEGVLLAVISAGADKTFQTTCGNDPTYTNKPAGSDDIVMSYTYAEAEGTGLWYERDGDRTVAEIDRNLAVVDDDGIEQLSFNSADKTFSLGTGGIGSFPSMKTDYIQQLTAGSVEFLSNIKLGDKWISGDGGDEGIRIDNDGRVGIGTTPAEVSLSVAANINVVGANATGKSITFKDSDGAGSSWSLSHLGSGDNFSISSHNGTTGTTRLTINDSGEVGVGTDPVTGYQLTSLGAIWARPGGSGRALQVGDSGSLYDIDVDNVLGLYGDDDSTLGGLQLGSTGAALYGKLGNLGVGESDPQQAIHTSGNLRTDGRYLYFGASQHLYGDNSTTLSYNSADSTTTQMAFKDLEGTTYGQVYGNGDGANFGLLDGDSDWGYTIVKDTRHEWRINNIIEMTLYPTYLDVEGNQIKNMADPTSAQDAATKAYVDLNIAAGTGFVEEDPQVGELTDTKWCHVVGTEIVCDRNDPTLVGDNLGNHTATTTLDMNGEDITGAGAVTATSFTGNGAGLTNLNGTNITTGTVSPARLGSGTTDSTTYLRGDGTWQPTSSLADNLGNHTATQDLDMADFEIINLNGIVLNSITADPPIGGGVVSDNLGDHTATMDLDMDGNDIINADAIIASTFTGNGADISDLNGSNISTGTVSPARLGSGTTDSTTYLRGDGTWQLTSSLGDNLGDHTATTALNMNSQNITSAATVTATLFSGSGASLTSLNGSNISSGTVAAARLGSGTTDNTTYLRGDGTWQLTSSLGDNLGDHTAVQNLDMDSYKIVNLLDPTAAQDAATKTYVDTAVAAGTGFVEQDPQVGALTDTKWCYADGTEIVCDRNDPTLTGDNLGDHTATMALDMDGQDIVNADSVTATTFTGNGAALTNLNGSNIASGTVSPARLGSGTADSTTYLRGDGTWQLTSSLGDNLGNHTATLALDMDGQDIVGADDIAAATFTGGGGALTNLNASNLSSGTVATARLGTGTANATTFLRGDGSWQTVSTGGDNLGNHTATTDLDMDSNKIVNLLDPTAAQDAATKAYVDAATASGGDNLGNHTATMALDLDGQNIVDADSVTAATFTGNGAALTNLNGSNIASGTVAAARLGSGTTDNTTYLRGDGTWQAASALGDNLGNHTATELLDMNNYDIENVSIITASTFIGNGAELTDLNGSSISSGTVAAARLGSGTTDATTVLRGDGTWQLTSSLGDDLGDHTATTDLDLNSNTIINLVDPTAAQDAATKAYVDAAVAAGTGFAEQDPQVGALTDTKWCYVVGTEIVCDRDDPTLTGDNLGDHLATEDLDMDSNDILNIQSAVFISVAGDPPLGLGSGSGGGGGGSEGDNLGDHTASEDLDMNGQNILDAATVTATLFSGSGASLTSLNGSNISSGTVAAARLGSGTTNSTTFLRGDGTWQATSGLGDNLGNHTATTALNMNSQNITSAATVTATLFSGSGASLTNLNASNLSSGTVGTARLGTGTANSTTFLRGDGSWQSPSGGPPPYCFVSSKGWLPEGDSYETECQSTCTSSSCGYQNRRKYTYTCNSTGVSSPFEGNLLNETSSTTSGCGTSYCSGGCGGGGGSS